MRIAWIRVFKFTILPLFVAGVQVVLDKSTNSRERRIEVFLIYLFALGLAGSGIGGFFSHFFISDLIAESIGWPAGNPFQFKVAFAILAIGVLGLIAVDRGMAFARQLSSRPQFLVLAQPWFTCWTSWKPETWHQDYTVQNIANLLKPALLIGFLATSRRAGRYPSSEVESAEFEAWRRPCLLAAGLITTSVATGFGIGFVLNQVLMITLPGIIVGSVLVFYILSIALKNPPIQSYKWPFSTMQINEL